jgi:hypothetical protein
VGTHGLAKRHQRLTRKKAVGVAIAHGLVESKLDHLPIGALRPGQQSSAAIAEPGRLGVDHHNAHTIIPSETHSNAAILLQFGGMSSRGATSPGARASDPRVLSSRTKIDDTAWVCLQQDAAQSHLKPRGSLFAGIPAPCNVAPDNCPTKLQLCPTHPNRRPSAMQLLNCRCCSMMGG